MEPYLQSNITVSKRNNFSKLRISAHNLAVETGRYSKPKTPVEMRKCYLCNTDEIEDEKHIMIYCNHYTDLRFDLYRTLTDIYENFEDLCDTDKFLFIMKMDYNSQMCRPILKFINCALDKRKESLGI